MLEEIKDLVEKYFNLIDTVKGEYASPFLSADKFQEELNELYEVWYSTGSNEAIINELVDVFLTTLRLMKTNNVLEDFIEMLEYKVARQYSREGLNYE